MFISQLLSMYCYVLLSDKPFFVWSTYDIMQNTIWYLVFNLLEYVYMLTMHMCWFVVIDTYAHLRM